MNFYGEACKKSKARLFSYCISLLALMFTATSFAETITVYPNTVISYPRTYNNVTLDLSHGSFIVKDNATLTIKNSVINGTLSNDIPVLFNVENGQLNFDHNQVNIKTDHLSSHPKEQSLQYVIFMGLGGLNLANNAFKIDNPFTAGLLITTSTIPSFGYQITKNTFEGFHGVLYLIASDNAVISDNIFTRNSYGNIVVIGNNDKIIHNSIFFSGNYHLGNSIDVIDSSNITISKNLLFTPTCHGIYVMSSHDMVIDGNRVSGGITYAINVLSFPERIDADARYLTKLTSALKMRNTLSNNIQITNNFMSQNRFGVAASDTDGLMIKNNIFIQHFEDSEARKFWTNNSILLQNITHLTWENNFYKEAYSQSMTGDNTHSNALMVFPKTGGIVF